MRSFVIASLLLAACHAPNVPPQMRNLKEHIEREGPGCYLHWGEQTQQYADRLVPVCEDLRKPQQRVYTFVMSEQQAADLVDSCYFGCSPAFKTLRGYYVRSDYLRADQIAISEGVLDDGAERSLYQHELCHSRHFDGDPVCDPHRHEPAEVAGTSQALTQGVGVTVYVIYEVDGELVSVPIEVEE